MGAVLRAAGAGLHAGTGRGAVSPIICSCPPPHPTNARAHTHTHTHTTTTTTTMTASKYTHTHPRWKLLPAVPAPHLSRSFHWPSIYTGSTAPEALGGGIVQPVYWFADMLAPYHVSHPAACRWRVSPPSAWPRLRCRAALLRDLLRRAGGHRLESTPPVLPRHRGWLLGRALPHTCQHVHSRGCCLLLRRWPACWSPRAPSPPTCPSMWATTAPLCWPTRGWRCAPSPPRAVATRACRQRRAR